MRRFFALLFLAVVLAVSGLSFAQGAPATALDFVKVGHTNLTGLIGQAASADRDQKINAQFDLMIDYGELAKGCFRADWAKLTPAQQVEVTDLLKKLVQKNYKKNLKRTLEYTVTYPSSSPQGATVRVHTVATNKTNARDTVEIDYLVVGAPGSFKIVDLITEGSSLTNSYYTQFTGMLANPAQGYPYIAQKIKDKLAKPD